MTQDVEIIVGGSLEEDGAAWTAFERGEDVTPSRVLAFEGWEGMSAVLTGKRYRLLRHLLVIRNRPRAPWRGRWDASSDRCMAMWSLWKLRAWWTVQGEA